jgi:DNA polymerase III gamma/tau subunit
MLAKILVSTSLESRAMKISDMLGMSYGHLGGGDINFKNHPDLLFLEAGEKLGIEQTKIIKEHFSYKPFQAEGRGVVIEDASTLTPEAQNSMLKTLEELSENSILIMGVNSENNLLPTILSRCQIVILEATQSVISDSLRPSILGSKEDSLASLQNDIEKLLNFSLEERFEYIEKLKEKKEFLQAMLQYFRNQLHASKSTEAIKNYLKELLEAEKWMNSNVNQRGILEYLMVIMPILDK